MNIDRLYDLAEAEHIKVYDYCVDEDINGMYLNYNKLNAIALNCDNSIHKKCVLSEEMGHYYYDATYHYKDEDKQLVDKQEYKAKKWSYYALVPFDNLRRAILSRKE